MAEATRKKPLILRAVSRMAVGGVQRGILATLSRADRDRFDYAVLCTKKEGTWASQVREMGIPLTCQKTLPPWNPFQILRLSRVIRRIRPDLVHVHMAPMVIPAVTAARLAGVKTYLIQHHSFYDRHWASQNALLRAWEWRLTRQAGAIIGVSEAVSRLTRDTLGLGGDKVHTVYNGIDCEKFMKAEPKDPRPEWGLPPETPLVVHVSRYLGTKRIEDFIEAAAQVLARWPAGRPTPAFVVIGGGADDYHKSYEKLIAKFGVGGRVILAGSRDDVPAILPTAQVGALASEIEGFGQVILEYLSAGLPVAATSLESITELVRHEREALLCPPRQPEQLAAHIERLLLDREYAQGLVEAGRRRLELFDWAAAVRGYEKIYCQLLGLAV